MIGIYQLICRINGHSYIGQSNDIERRWYEHSRARSRCTLINRAIKKYGWESFDKKILEICNLDELDEREIYWIATLKPEYNICQGGHGTRGYKPSSELKEILRQASKKAWGRKTPEEKEFIIKHNLKGPAEGHSVSEETREKLRQANLGKKQSKETIEKRVESLRGRKRKNSYMFKPVICVETGEIFPSIKDAAVSVGINQHAITDVLRGYRNRKTAGGYHWAYLNEDDNPKCRRHFSEDVRKKLCKTNTHKKSVICVETGEIFESVKKAAEKIGVVPSFLSSVLNGKKKTAGGYHWKFYDSVETNHDECSDVGEKNELLLEVHGNPCG